MKVFKSLIWWLFSIVCGLSFKYCTREIKLLNNKPIIGILAQDIYHSKHPGKSFWIAASYVKFIESAGGRVVPIYPNQTKNELLNLFNKINGVVFPGGNSPEITSSFYKSAKQLYDFAIEANDRGDYYPIWSTCLGFQAIQVMRHGNVSVLSRCDSVDYNAKLEFRDSYNRGRLFGKAPLDMISTLENEAITYNHHKFCIKPDEYEKHDLLNNFFNILTTSKDRSGAEFISTIEGIKYPFFGTQWHPEKNPYEWTTSETINHSETAIRISQYMANVFLSETRKNGHKFQDAMEETKHLIHNACSTLTILHSNFEEIYYF